MTYIVKGKAYTVSERQDILTLLWSCPSVDPCSIQTKLSWIDSIKFKINCEENEFKILLSNLSNLGFVVEKVKQRKEKKKEVGRL